MRIIKDTNIDFMRQRKLAFLISTVVILSGLISLLVNGGPKLSIDFKGGSLVSVQYSKDMDILAVRSAMGKLNIEGQSFDFSREEIKHFGNPGAVLIRVPHIDSAPQNFAQKIVDHLYNSFPEMVPENKSDFILGKGTVSPKIGSELNCRAMIYILHDIILLYISIRFEFRFALGAIAALTHDVFVTLGLFSLLGYEISLPIVAAFLTIVGYSLNDTIVIFDRIRENIKASKKETYETISKMINFNFIRFNPYNIFSCCCWSMYFGGEVIHNFALAMIIGVIVGTYSSIYIASPIVIQLHENSIK